MFAVTLVNLLPSSHEEGKERISKTIRSSSLLALDPVVQRRGQLLVPAATIAKSAQATTRAGGQSS